MSKVLNVTLSDEIYSRLLESAGKMSLTKSGYVNYALRQMFNQEDMMTKFPDILDQMKTLSNQLKERTEQ